jgi:glucan phosphoethanolaminetransferase (alkaline phosphatase superfamily)
VNVAAINYYAIPAAAIAAFIWGAIYYMTLSKQWLAAVGQTEPNRSPAPFILSFVALLVMAFVLSGAIAHLGPGQGTIRNGIISGLILWTGFVVTTVFVNNAYPGRKYMLSIIDSIHWLGVLVIQGAVIGALGAK